MTTMRSERASASDWAWVTKTKVTPKWRCKSFSSFWIALAQIGVERTERLIEKQDVRLDHKAAGERDALLLPTRQSLRR